jgi:hypothetical protein
MNSGDNSWLANGIAEFLRDASIVPVAPPTVSTGSKKEMSKQVLHSRFREQGFPT